MISVNFSRLLYRFCQLAGLDRDNITDQNFKMFRDFFTSRVGMAWNSEYWSQGMRIQSQAVTNLSAGVGFILPSDVEELINVLDADPRVTNRTAQIGFMLTEDGTYRYAVLQKNAPSTVWIEYKVDPIETFGDAYSASIAYEAGSQIYFDTSTNSGAYSAGAGKIPAGNFYNVLSNTTAGQNPTSNPTLFQKVEVPEFLGEHLVRACLSDFLRSEGQFDQATQAEAEAEAERQVQVDKLIRQQGQVRKINMITY